MAKIFYDHLIETHEIIAEIDRHKIDVVEREEIIQLVFENTHNRILHTILDNLPKHKHEEFLVRFHKEPHDPSLLDYLKKEVKNIEELIRKEATKLKKEIFADIKHAQRS